jgi:hypothetical protein
MSNSGSGVQRLPTASYLEAKLIEKDLVAKQVGFLLISLRQRILAVPDQLCRMILSVLFHGRLDPQKDTFQSDNVPRVQSGQACLAD